MRVMVMVKATSDSEAGKMPGTELLAAMGNFNEELVKAGVMLAGEGLHPSARGKRVLFSGRQRTVTDGPFAETKELVAGFWLWKVNSMEEAVAAASPLGTLERQAIRKRFKQRFTAERMAREYLAAYLRLPALRQTPQLDLLAIAKCENEIRMPIPPVGLTLIAAGAGWHRLHGAGTECPGDCYDHTQELSTCAARNHKQSVTSSTWPTAPRYGWSRNGLGSRIWSLPQSSGASAIRFRPSARRPLRGQKC